MALVSYQLQQSCIQTKRLRDGTASKDDRCNATMSQRCVATSKCKSSLSRSDTPDNNKNTHGATDRQCGACNPGHDGRRAGDEIVTTGANTCGPCATGTFVNYVDNDVNGDRALSNESDPPYVGHCVPATEGHYVDDVGRDYQTRANHDQYVDVSGAMEASECNAQARSDITAYHTAFAAMAKKMHTASNNVRPPSADNSEIGIKEEYTTLFKPYKAGDAKSELVDMKHMNVNKLGADNRYVKVKKDPAYRTECRYCLGGYGRPSGTIYTVPAPAPGQSGVEAGLCESCPLHTLFVTDSGGGRYNDGLTDDVCAEASKCPHGTGYSKNTTDGDNAPYAYGNDTLVGDLGEATNPKESKGLCPECRPGRFSGEDSSSGNYPNDRGDGQRVDHDVCDYCPPGWFTGDHGQSVCKACDPGDFQPETGKSSCIKCQWNFNGPHTEYTTSRSQGVVTNTLGNTGADQCNECAPGTYDDDNDSTTPCITHTVSFDGVVFDINDGEALFTK